MAAAFRGGGSRWWWWWSVARRWSAVWRWSVAIDGGPVAVVRGGGPAARWSRSGGPAPVVPCGGSWQRSVAVWSRGVQWRWSVVVVVGGGGGPWPWWCVVVVVRGGGGGPWYLAVAVVLGGGGCGTWHLVRCGRMGCWAGGVWVGGCGWVWVGECGWWEGVGGWDVGGWAEGRWDAGGLDVDSTTHNFTRTAPTQPCNRARKKRSFPPAHRRFVYIALYMRYM